MSGKTTRTPRLLDRRIRPSGRLAVMIVGGLLLLIAGGELTVRGASGLALTHRQISRLKGGVLLLGYAGYLGWLSMR